MLDAGVIRYAAPTPAHERARGSRGMAVMRRPVGHHLVSMAVKSAAGVVNIPGKPEDPYTAPGMVGGTGNAGEPPQI